MKFRSELGGALNVVDKCARVGRTLGPVLGAFPWLVVFASSGVLLLAAAFLKVAAGPVEGWGLAGHLLLVHAEVALGVWLLGGWYSRAASWVGCVCFAAFAVYSAYRGIAGHHSCGCFGNFVVNPWITASVDVVLAIGLGLSARYGSGEPSQGWRVTRGVAGGVIGAGILVFAWWPHAMAKPMDADTVSLGVVSGNLIVLEPDGWVNQRFALAGKIHDGEQLMEGDWIVLLHQHGCSMCQAAIPTYLESLPRLRDAGVRLALIEVTPTGENMHHESGVWTSHLTTDHEWFASTPIVARVRDGEVLHVHTGQDAADASRVLDGLSASK